MRYPSRQRIFFATREALMPGGSADGAAATARAGAGATLSEPSPMYEMRQIRPCASSKM